MNRDSCFSSYYIGAQGFHIYYRSWMPAELRALIVLLHGSGEHSGYYSHIGEKSLRYRVGLIIPDLRGFGKSEGHRGHINRFEEYLVDLEALIILLQSRYPGVPIFLLGHSLGGLIAIRYSQEYNGKAKGVILSSPVLGMRFPLPYPLKKMTDLLSWIAPSLPIEPFKWSWLRSILLGSSSESLHDPLFTIQYTPRWFAEMLQNGVRALSETAKYSLPTLVLYGGQDPLINQRLLENFFLAIPHEDKKSIMFSDGGHRPLHEHHQEEVVHNIFDWVTVRSSGSAG
ncbi:alpha/beta fold hydrolase [Brevibacillus massiliensis]|jgi:lysophospholipase|uniref:alpha/beta fold hydrolase n=1 Tax=Brevibacillus massiliensis TaxID=1118054 RepID=UPI0003124496|nr:alpha/beta fold hydrolase [Brevibacillus massiliensis]